VLAEPLRLAASREASPLSERQLATNTRCNAIEPVQDRRALIREFKLSPTAPEAPASYMNGQRNARRVPVAR
jgi:hypothetical protein